MQCFYRWDWRYRQGIANPINSFHTYWCKAVEIKRCAPRMGSSMSDVWTRWDFPKFHQPLFFTASFSVSPFKLYFVVLYPLGNCGYREQNYVKQTSLFIKNFIFRFCSKELSGGCDLYLCTLSETGKSLSFSWKFRKKEQSWSRLSSESLFKKKKYMH